MVEDPFGAIRDIDIGDKTYQMADLMVLEEEGVCDLDSLPVSIRILLESVLRHVDGKSIRPKTFATSRSGNPTYPMPRCLFHPHVSCYRVSRACPL